MRKRDGRRVASTQSHVRMVYLVAFEAAGSLRASEPFFLS